MKKGDSVSVEFSFTDLSGKKRRPALVLAVDAADATLAFITTKLYQIQAGDVLLTSSILNGLKLPPAIRVSKLATLRLTLVRGKLGELAPAEILAVDAGLIQALAIQTPA